MLTIRCATCRDKIFKYEKIGKGRVLRCYKVKIREDYTELSDSEVKCKCGNIIGKDEGPFIKMKQSSFIYSGTVTKK
jgi:hypothetical protein